MLSSISTSFYTAPDRHIIPRGFVAGLIPMSTGDDKSRESSPSRSPQRSRASSVRSSSARSSSARAPSARRRQGPANVIEFVDSQDPNVKSAIQRHTAYHSAAQRREARMQSLRRGTQSRYLDWGRRQGTESAPAISPESSSSPSHYTAMFQSTEADFSLGSLSTTPAPVLPPTDRQILGGQSSSESATPIPALTAAEEAILQFSRFYIRAQHQLVPSNHDSINHLQQLSLDTIFPHPTDLQPLEATIAFIRLDEVSTQLLLAYAYSLRARLQESPSATETDNQSAQAYLTRGTMLLRNRLRDSQIASSDVNIQAVLLLVSYTADFGVASEVDIHADALRTMVQERGGLAALSASGTGSPVLHRQLAGMDGARRYHLTLGCGEDCCRGKRFPEGFWPRPQQ